MIGRHIGNYVIIAPIGSGGMGQVFEAKHVEIGKRAAVKILRQDLSNNMQMANRFLNEARAASIIDHPGIVETFEFGRLDDGTTYIVMELLKGVSLGQRLRDAGGRLAPAAAAEMLHVVCSG